jgi:hypothetical protein
MTNVADRSVWAEANVQEGTVGPDTAAAQEVVAEWHLVARDLHNRSHEASVHNSKEQQARNNNNNNNNYNKEQQPQQQRTTTANIIRLTVWEREHLPSQSPRMKRMQTATLLLSWMRGHWSPRLHRPKRLKNGQ